MKGFTLVELLIVIAITLILAAVSAPLYGNLQVSSQLNDSTSQMLQAARIARERAVAGVNNSAHGVFFEINAGADDRYILYQGSSYATRVSEHDRETTLPQSLSISTTLPGADLNFSGGLGMPNSTGTVTLTHGANGTRMIVINSFGMVEE